MWNISCITVTISRFRIECVASAAALHTNTCIWTNRIITSLWVQTLMIIDLAFVDICDLLISMAWVLSIVHMITHYSTYAILVQSKNPTDFNRILYDENNSLTNTCVQHFVHYKARSTVASIRARCVYTILITITWILINAALIDI